MDDCRAGASGGFAEVDVLYLVSFYGALFCVFFNGVSRNFILLEVWFYPVGKTYQKVTNFGNVNDFVLERVNSCPVFATST